MVEFLITLLNQIASNGLPWTIVAVLCVSLYLKDRSKDEATQKHINDLSGGLRDATVWMGEVKGLVDKILIILTTRSNNGNN